ncbi:MAG: DJ-1 family glyoxalase III [Lentisphaerota bacterium]
MNKILVLLAEGFEEVEALLVVDFLRRLNFEVDLVSVGNSRDVAGSHGIKVIADLKLVETDEVYDGIVLPGGMPGSANLRDNNLVIMLIKKFYNESKLVAAICAAPIALYKAGVLKGKKHTAHPSVKDTFVGSIYTGARVEICGNIITGKGPGASAEFAMEIARYFGSVDEAEKLYYDMMFN